MTTIFKKGGSTGQKIMQNLFFLIGLASSITRWKYFADAFTVSDGTLANVNRNLNTIPKQTQHLKYNREPDVKKPSPLSATIFSYDEESDSQTSSFDASSSILDENYPDATSSVSTLISNDDTKMSSLARLAVAFSPPGQSLDLEQIRDLQIVNVDPSHIEISAVVCDEMQCVTLLVPINFPHSCGSTTGMEECVLENIDELDEEAQGVIQKRNEIEHYQASSQHALDEDIMSALHASTENVELPNWWISPETNRDLVEECQLIRRLLNQEAYMNEVIALASIGLQEEMMHDVNIAKAIVMAVGPSGLYFRAATTNQDGTYTILDIPLRLRGPDGSQTLNDPESLRAAVLGAIAMVQR
jgi:hypothetical protein